VDAAFATHVRNGLRAPAKRLSSMYFYDDAGSRLFQQIMAMPEYYLTGSEFEILDTQAHHILDKLGWDGPFDILEFGAGDGMKTARLLQHFLAAGARLRYRPIDISQAANDSLKARLAQSLPDLDTAPLTGDYFDLLDGGILDNERPVLLLFLGSNIGNFEPDAARAFLQRCQQALRPGDHMLVGFDLDKNPVLIHQAYYDPHGITKAFNLNLLLRINRELDADFAVDQFDFYCCYSPEERAVRSYLVSLKAQQVRIGALRETFSFGYHELLRTELSRKFTLEGISNLASTAGFKHTEHFLDCRHYFATSLWRKPGA
jgi:dimethylhistidine N-methyltransferase